MESEGDERRREEKKNEELKAPSTDFEGRG